MPKLSPLDTQTIRILATKDYTQGAIATSFNTTQSHVSATLRKRGISLLADKGRRDKRRTVSPVAKLVARMQARLGK